MSLLREFLMKQNLTEFPPPKSKEYFGGINAIYYVAIGFAIFATIAVIMLAAMHLFFVLRYVSHPSMQTDLYWIVFLCPIVSICNTVGICAPRTAAFLYSVGVVYFLLCIFVLVTLMTTLYGSRTAMCHKLEEKGVELNPRVFPLGCCLVCLPNIKPTAKNIRMLEWAVFQSPIIRVIIEIVSVAVYFELETKQNWFFTPANLISFISMIIASYSSYILMPAGCKQLSQYRFLAMFRMVDWAQFVYNVQRHVLDGIILTDIFGSDNFFMLEILGPTTTVQIWTSFLATLEMLILSLLATYFFRPSEAAFFDKFFDSSQRNITPAIAPRPSPNPFVCHPALEATMSDEHISPKISTEKQPSKIVAEKKASKETSPKLIITTLIDGEKLKLKELEQQQQPSLPPPHLQSQPPPPEEPQHLSPNGNDKTKTPVTVTTTATNTPLHTSLIDPNSTTNVEILQVEPTQEPTDKILS